MLHDVTPYKINSVDKILSHLKNFQKSNPLMVIINYQLNNYLYARLISFNDINL